MTNKEIVQTWFAALDAKDFDTIKSLMGSGYQFQNPIAPAPINANEHLGMMQMFASAFDATHEFDMIIAEGNYVVVSGKWRGKHIGEFNGVPATGKLVTLNFIDTYQLADGKVVNHHIEFNPMPMLALSAS